MSASEDKKVFFLRARKTYTFEKKLGKIEDIECKFEEYVNSGKY